MKVKSILIQFLILLLVFVGCRTPNPTNKQETRATWISYIDYTQMLWGKNESDYSKNVDEIINNLKSMKLNTIYIHASAFTDAYYPSQYYPSAQYITGKIGDSFPFDPFKIFVDKAKAAGFKIEAWINPLRSFTKEQMNSVPNTYLIKQWAENKSRNLIFHHDRYYLNPAYQEVHDLILDVVQELISNYDIDGIHMDDYFYPDHVNSSFDAIDFELLNPNMKLEDWRRSNITSLVQSLSTVIKKTDKNCNFSISPAGNIQYTTETIFGDVKTWIQEGLIDTIIPQIYFGYYHETLPYDLCLKEWETLVSQTKVKLVVGLAAYKINAEDPYANSGRDEWKLDHDILARQIEQARKATNYSGFSLFSYHSIMYPNPEDSLPVSKQLESVTKLLEN